MTTDGEHEARIRAAVVETPAAVEAPGRDRLARIEARLLVERRRRANPWRWVWLGLGLVADTAAAYWGLFAGHRGSGASETEKPSTIEHETSSGSRLTGREEAGQTTESDSESSDEGSPVIYIGQ